MTILLLLDYWKHFLGHTWNSQFLVLWESPLVHSGRSWQPRYCCMTAPSPRLLLTRPEVDTWLKVGPRYFLLGIENWRQETGMTMFPYSSMKSREAGKICLSWERQWGTCLQRSKDENYQERIQLVSGSSLAAFLPLVPWDNLWFRFFPFYLCLLRFIFTTCAWRTLTDKPVGRSIFLDKN